MRTAAREIEPEAGLDRAPSEIQHDIDLDAAEIADAPAREPGFRAEVEPVPGLDAEMDDIDHGFGGIGSVW